MRLVTPAQVRTPAHALLPVPLQEGPAPGAPTTGPTPARPVHHRWHREYVRRIVVADTVAVGVAVGGAQLLRFGLERPRNLPYPLVGAALVVLWLAMLSLYRTRDRRIVGEGTEEYRRLSDATLRLFGLVAIVALLLRLEFARGYLLLAFPLGLVFLLLGRKLTRTWLVRRRAEGGHCARVVVVGSMRSARTLARALGRDPAGGYRVVAACVPGVAAHPPRLGGTGADVPVWGDENTVEQALRECDADTVAVTATDLLGPERMRELAWQLQALDVDLVVAPEVVDVAGPRLTMRPVAGLPLLHVEEPQYAGAGRAGKLVLDVVVALVALAVALPVLVVAAVAIRATSPGPVLYRSERIGVRGRPFSMLKLRTMVVGADAGILALTHADQGSGPLFKVRADPRVTSVGRVLRRLSLDELPQFVNVLRGDMSVVGPRPPLRREVDTYSGEVARKLLVKPGITGLWQVSGRSDLSWEESVRLDLFYVENWSTMQDLQIIWRTTRAVLRGHGAY